MTGARRTSDCDLHADIHENEKREQVHRFQPEDLPVLAVLTRPRFTGSLADLRQAFYARPVGFNTREKVERHGAPGQMELLTVLSFKPEHDREDGRVREGNAEGDQVVERPVPQLRELRRDERGRQGSRACNRIPPAK